MAPPKLFYYPAHMLTWVPSWLRPPTELLGRVRWYFLLLPLLSATLFSVPVLVAALPRTPMVALLGLLLLGGLSGWWLHGYRRAGFPAWSSVGEAVAIFGMGLAVGDAQIMTGFTYCSLFFRALYGTPKEVRTLALAYLAALLGAIAFGPHMTLELTSPLVLGNIPGFAVVAYQMGLLTHALNQHERVVKRERLLRHAGAAFAATADRTVLAQTVLFAALELTEQGRDVGAVVALGTPDQPQIVAATAAANSAEVAQPLYEFISGQSSPLPPIMVIKATDARARQLRHSLSQSERTEDLLLLPLRTEQRLHGVLVLETPQPVPDDTHGAVIALAIQAALAFERAALSDALAYQAFHDALTDLPNRALFLDRLQHALARAERQQAGVAVLFLDLDGFKHINDRLGHAQGDHLLQAVGQRLRPCVRPSDTVARLGGDEFTVLLEDVASSADVQEVAERIIHSFDAPFQLDGQAVQVSTSVGIALRGPGVEEATDILRAADQAMYAAKRTGPGSYVFFTPSASRP